MRIFKFGMALSLLVPSLVMAQQTTGSRLGSKPAQISETQNKTRQLRLIFDEYARCVIESYPMRVEKFLQMIPSGKSYNAAANDISVDTCLSTGEIGFSRMTLRTALFDRFYRRKFKSLITQDFSTVESINYFDGMDTDQLKSHGAALEFADCVVRANPTASHGLISTKIATDAEADMFKVVLPTMGPCLVAGSEVKFSRSILRGYIAEALYRLSEKAKPAGAKGSQ